MRVLAKYSQKNGESVLRAFHSSLLDEVEEVIGGAQPLARSTSARGIFSSKQLTRTFRRALRGRGWEREQSDSAAYAPNYIASTTSVPVPHRPQITLPCGRELEYVKDRLGLRVSLRMPLSAVYGGCAEMTIFRNKGLIDAGIEVVPVKSFADQMSTGVSYFEQIVWDLEHRKEADIDVPVLVLGIGG